VPQTGLEPVTPSLRMTCQRLLPRMTPRIGPREINRMKDRSKVLILLDEMVRHPE
jgi:hypothetical protein